MTKNCLLKDEKTAPFLRQKPAKNALFSSISQEKVEQNKKAMCHRYDDFPAFFIFMVSTTFIHQHLT